MPSVNEMVPHKYLNKYDVDNNGKGMVLTIRELKREQVQGRDGKSTLEWLCYFHEHLLPLILKKTNLMAIAKITGEQDTANWIGHKILAYHKTDVSFGGEEMGGLRVRAPKPEDLQPAPAPAPARDPNDDLPF